MDVMPQHRQLAKFYEVSTSEELIDAQAAHIVRLQETVRRLKPEEQVFDRVPREG